MAERSLGHPSVDGRSVAEFLLLTFAISWGGVTVLVFAGFDLGSGAGQGIGTIIFMGGPAIAAIALLGLRGKSIRRGTGLYLGRLRWIAVAWMAPVGLTAVMIAVGLLLPDTTLTTEYPAFLLELGLTEGDAVEAIADMEGTGVPVVVLLVGFGLVLGGTIFALAALGEELGWRGLLLTELAPLGFWKLSLWTGLVWGIWHAPLILIGLQFPDDPVVGVFSMTGATVAWAPIYTYLTVRAQSVLAATFLHGSFFIGVFTSVFLAGGSELVSSPFGVVGIGSAMVGIAACIGHDRFLADEQIATGAPLRPWAGSGA